MVIRYVLYLTFVISFSKKVFNESLPSINFCSIEIQPCVCCMEFKWSWTPFHFFFVVLKLGTTFHLTFQSVYFETLCDFDMDYFPGKGPFDLEMQGVASCSNGQGKARVRMRTESSPPTPALILQYSSSIRFAKNVLECTSTTKALSSVWHEIGVIQMSCPCQGYKPSLF